MNSFYVYKTGMTQVWDETGKRYSATILKASPQTVTQVKSIKSDGYSALQIATGLKPAPATKTMAGHLKPSNLTQKPRHLREIRIKDNAPLPSTGDTLTIDQTFAVGDIVAAQGVSKGRGFSGVMKRWGFKGGPRTHGQSDRARAPGSIGQGTDPGRVHKGKKMAGRFGNQTFTIKNLIVLSMNPKTNEILVSGPVPGAANALITLTKLKTGKPLKLVGEVQIPVESNDQPAATQPEETSPTPPTPSEPTTPVKDQPEEKKDAAPTKAGDKKEK
jgi:large subunit ribosomal protein L3